MAKPRRFPPVVNVRCYCTACEEWYQCLVSRAWYVRHCITHPDTPARVCGLCKQAMRQAVIAGGQWRDWRNWERAACDLGVQEGPPPPDSVI